MRPTYLEVNLQQLRQNLEHIRAHVSPAKVMVMVKANAYGHGLDGVAPYIERYADYLGVALVEEGVRLRQLGITKPILVGGGILSDQLPLFAQYDLTATVGSLELLAAAELCASASGEEIKVHLKIDTGMERVGMHEFEAAGLLEKSLACSHLDVEGIYSHFANSELRDRSHALLQLERFFEVLRFYEARSLSPPRIRHLANSGGILQMPEAHLDLVRPGILFYGVYPGQEAQRTIDVAPALVWRSRVAYSKITPAGRPVSYGSLWTSTVPTRIATVPCGYGDGYFRRMTNQARVIVNGRQYPQVGRICMDQFMVNVGDDPAQVGDEIVLLGGEIAASDLAQWAGTNEYEVLTNISARVPRVYVGADEDDPSITIGGQN